MLHQQEERMNVEGYKAFLVGAGMIIIVTYMAISIVYVVDADNNKLSYLDNMCREYGFDGRDGVYCYKVWGNNSMILKRHFTCKGNLFNEYECTLDKIEGDEINGLVRK